ncbi:MAG TPA: DPP IV N-terminal domain-containing protein, partial [Thermoanaerobaculia bacterium]|nr:DPP IV N-terminal domain-containing protein [Thermoanaerobaculia bacterium]
VEWRLYDVATGKDRTLIDKAKLQAALESTGLASDIAKDAASSDSVEFDAKKSAIVLDVADDLYLYSLTRNSATRLTSAPGEEENPTFSPDGQKIAFVRDSDLYVVDLAGRERRLTTDGTEKILNGKLDYVYQEEVYGRGQWSSFWWSPDSTRLAFLQLDERQVPEVVIPDHIPYHMNNETIAYPKAGDPNPKVKLFVVGASGGAPKEMDTERYTGSDFLIVNVGWNRDASALTYQVQNREQTWLDLVSASPSDGKGKTLFRETTPAWVDPIANPSWLDDGSFLWQSERSGFRHIYHYKADGTLVRQVTNGEWEVRDLHGTDKTYIYFSGTERSVRDNDVYRVKLDGSGFQRLSADAGTHAATFNPSLTRYVDRWNDIRTPDQVRLYTSDGKLARVIDENKVTTLAEYDLPQPEFLQVKNRDGFPMEAMILKPTNFDPSKKYPVYQYLYAGPHAQQVVNRWRGQSMLFMQLVAQQGIIVWQCDNKTASGKGAVSTWPVYKNFGESELRDIEDGIQYLAKQPYVDASRVLLNGWSYGGFMVSYALTHSKMFSAGIAGGTVADWRDYDTIYTERYLLMPQNNPDGYKKSSPRFAAKDLHGNLLLLHGTIDDNVHLQNTIQFAWELQQAGKQFEMMLYPKARHGVRDRKSVNHLNRLMFDFTKRQLLATGSQN